jgi:TP901 family phage tail tape measure protein
LADDQNRLIGELRIGIERLKSDVDKVNKELAKINNGKENINLDVGITNAGKELDKFSQKYKTAAGESQKLVSETRILTNEYGKQIKIIDEINKETQKVERTTKELSMDYKKLGTEMANARDKYMNKLHGEALQINKQIDNETSKRKLALEKQQQLELRSQEKIIQDRKKIETDYEQWWLKQLKEKEVKAEQSARKVAQQQALQTEKVNQSQFQSALQARQGMNIMGSTNTMGSGDARASVVGKMLNSAIYTTAYYGYSALVNTVNDAIETNKQYELGLVDLSRTLNNVTQTDLKAYGKQAIQFAKDFAVPLQEVQNAMTELARAGVDNKADLEAMTKSVLTGLNTTEINSATEMTGYLVSAVRQLGMEFKDSMSIIDGWNKLADKYAVQSNDFAEAIQKAGSASKTLGLDINDVNAMVVMLGEATQASGMEIGQALKSLEVRLLRPDTVKTLESYGIAVKKDAEHFLSFQQIMQNVDNATKNLSDDSIQLNDIMDALGGTWRRNWAQILTNDWGRFDEIRKQSIDSFGYSVKENEKVLQTFDAQLKKFQATIAEVFVSMGQEGGVLEQLKGMTNLTTNFAQAFANLPPEIKKSVVVFGELAIVTKLFSLAAKNVTGIGLSDWLSAVVQSTGKFVNTQQIATQVTTMLDKALKAGNITQVEYGLIMESVSTKLGVANVSSKALNTAQTALAKTQLGLAMSTLAVNAAITAGIALLTIGIVALWQHYEDLKRTSEEYVETKTKEINQLKDLKKEYSGLIEQQSQGIDVLEDLKRVETEIVDLLPNKVAAWQTELDARTKIVEAVDEEIKKKGELIAAELRPKVDDVFKDKESNFFSYTLGARNFDTRIKNLNDYNDTILKVNKALDLLKSQGKTKLSDEDIVSIFGSLDYSFPGGGGRVTSFRFESSLMKFMNEYINKKNKDLPQLEKDIKTITDYYSSKYGVYDEKFIKLITETILEGQVLQTETNIDNVFKNYKPDVLDRNKIDKINTDTNPYFTSEKDKEIYTAKINQFQQLEHALALVNYQLERNNILTDLSSETNKINLLSERVKLLKDEQKAMYNLNEARRNTVEKNVEELDALGLGATYNRETDTLKIANRERLNEILLEEAKVKGLTVEQTNDLIKSTETLISDTDSLVEAILKEKAAWWSVESGIKKVGEESKKLNEEKLKNVEDVEKKIVEIIKKRFELEKEVEEDAHNKRLKNYDDDLKSYQEHINDKLNLLENQYEKDDYDRQLQEEREKLLEIQKKINTLSLDDSLEARGKVLELTKEKAEQEKQIEDLKLKYNRDARKKNLQDNLKDYEKYINNKKDKENKDFEDFKKDLEARSEEGKIYLEAQQALLEDSLKGIDGQLVSLESAFQSFEERFGQGFSNLGETIKDNFTKNLKDAQETIDGIKGNNPFGMSKSDFAKYKRNKKDWESGIRQEEAATENAALRKKYGISSDQFSYENIKGYYSNGGKVIENQVAMLHATEQSPEWVLRDFQLRDIVTIAIADLLPKIDIPASSPSGIGDTIIQFDSLVNIEGNVEESAVPKISSNVNAALERLKREHIKSGGGRKI